MDFADGPTAAELATAGDRELLELYTQVMGAMMASPDEDPRDRSQPAGDVAAISAAPTETAALRTYRLVHDEMMRRHRDTPGLWEPSEGPTDLGDAHEESPLTRASTRDRSGPRRG